MPNDVIFQYVRWHYRDGFADVFARAEARVFGLFNFFSVAPLARTILAPWHRITDSYGEGFDPNTFFQTLVGNLMSRVIGAFVRLFVIGIGLLITLGAVLFSIIAVATWIIAPLLVVVLPIAGILLVVS